MKIERHATAIRIGLIYLAVTIGLVAAMILISPRGFYDDFHRPSAWVSYAVALQRAPAARLRRRPGLGGAGLARRRLDGPTTSRPPRSRSSSACCRTHLPRHHLRELLHRRQHRQPAASCSRACCRWRSSTSPPALRQEPGALRPTSDAQGGVRCHAWTHPNLSSVIRLTWRIAKRKAGGDRVPEPVAVILPPPAPAARLQHLRARVRAQRQGRGAF